MGKIPKTNETKNLLEGFGDGKKAGCGNLEQTTGREFFILCDFALKVVTTVMPQASLGG